MSAKQPHVCGAKTRTGKECHQPAMQNGRCRLHGGKTPAGVASPHFKTGRHSKFIPARLTERYNEARTDEELLELREEVALLDARLSDLLGRVDTGESGALLAAARKALTQYKATYKRDETKAFVALMELEDTILAGTNDYAAWNEIATIIEQRRKLVESERKRLVEMQQMLTVEKAMFLIGAIGGIIKAHVTDRTQLSAISSAINSLVTVEASE